MQYFPTYSTNLFLPRGSKGETRMFLMPYSVFYFATHQFVYTVGLYDKMCSLEMRVSHNMVILITGMLFQ